MQLFNFNEYFMELIEKGKYKGSSIQMAEPYGVRFNVAGDVNDINSHRKVSRPQGGSTVGRGVVFLTDESSIIISSTESGSIKLGEKYEAIGRIVNDYSSVDGAAIQQIIGALYSARPKAVSIRDCFKVRKG